MLSETIATSIPAELVPPHRRSAVEQLWNYDLSFLRERLIMQQIMPTRIIDDSIVEYRKFMSLMLIFERGQVMCSPEVDEVWHNHILFTRNYAEFSQQIFDKFMHHDPIMPSQPSTHSGVDSIAAFFEAYRAVFGEPSYLWGRPVDNTHGAG